MRAPASASTTWTVKGIPITSSTRRHTKITGAEA